MDTWQSVNFRKALETLDSAMMAIFLSRVGYTNLYGSKACLGK